MLVVETPSTSATKQPVFHFTRSQPGVRETYIESFGLFGRESVFESEARGAAHVLSEKLAEAHYRSFLGTYNVFSVGANSGTRIHFDEIASKCVSTVT